MCKIEAAGDFVTAGHRRINNMESALTTLVASAAEEKIAAVDRAN